MHINSRTVHEVPPQDDVLYWHSDGHRRRSRPLPPLPEADCPLFVGKYDYNSRTEGYLGFKKGDLLYIINTNDADWWFAQQWVSGDKGVVPSNYIAEYKSLDAKEWVE